MPTIRFADVVRRPDGSFAAVMPDGTRQPLSPSMLHDIELPMSAVQDEQGVSGTERMSFKALYNNPEEARRYLEGIGYETRRLPEEAGEWNFAVRKSDRDPWRLIDPTGPDVMDIFDFVGDAMIGATTLAGGVLGSLVPGPGTLLGAGAGAAVGEAGREALGGLLQAGAGVADPQQIDPLSVGLEGAFGAVSGPIADVSTKLIGRMLRGTARGSERLAAAFTSRMVGVRNSRTSSAGELMIRKAKRVIAGEKATARVPGAGEHAKGFVGLMDDLVRAQRGAEQRMTMPLRKLQLQQLKAVGTGTHNGVRAGVDIRASLNRLRKMVTTTSETVTEEAGKGGKFGPRQTVRGTKTTVDNAARSTEETFIPRGKGGRMQKPLRKRVTRTTTSTKLPLPDAVKKFLAHVDRRLAAAKANSSFVAPDVVDDIIEEMVQHIENPRISGATLDGFTEAAEILERDLLQTMDDAGMPHFIRYYDELQSLRRKMARIRFRTLPGKNPAARRDATAKFLEAIDADSKMDYRAYLSDIEKQFGFDQDFLTSIADEVELSRSFPFRGGAELIGPLTAGGTLRGPALGAGLGLGTGLLLGGPQMGALGAAAGAAIGSPPIQTHAMATVLRLGSVLTGAERRLTSLAAQPSVRFSAPLAAQIAARHIASPVADSVVVQQKPRKETKIGQF